MLVAAVTLLTSGRSWAVYNVLGPSKDEWGLKYDVQVSDANEVVTNGVKHNLVCTGNSPKVQVGDSTGGPNVVGGKALGQCAHIT